MNRVAALAGFSLGLGFAWSGGARAADQPTAQQNDAAEVERVETLVQTVSDRLTLVEREYGQAEDPSELLELRRRFAEGETQYLLGEYANAAALLYDVVDAPIYRPEESRPDAMFYLADSLYREGSWLEARRYFRELAELRVPRHLQDSLLRLIDLSEKVNDHTGIEELYQALIGQAGTENKVKPEVVYVHAKWTARRSDLPDEQRISLALASFGRIGDASEFGAQSRYFEGALLVQRGQLELAQAAFEKVLALPQVKNAPTAADVALTPVGLTGEAAVKAGRAAKASRMRDLALLAIGRVMFETGKTQDAIAHYLQIEHDSDSYNDALYELSACYQKQGEFEKALHITDLLLLLVEDSTIAPEARLQQASLQLRIKRYEKAIDSYEQLGNEMRPVQARIQELVSVPDPVAYYNQLLERGQSTLDTTQLLPEVARKYITGRDASTARVIIEQLGAGRQGLQDSRVLLETLDAALQSGKLELFPTLQEGNLRALEVENALVRADGQLVTIESRLVLRADPTVAAQLQAARAQRQQLDARVAQLPDSAAEFEQRKAAALARVAQLAKADFRLGQEIDSLEAQLTAAEKWQKDTSGERLSKATAGHRAEAKQAEAEFVKGIDADRVVVRELEADRQRIERALDVAKGSVVGAVGGGDRDDKLRADYTQAAKSESAASAAVGAQLPPRDRALETRIQGAIATVSELRQRVATVRSSIRARAQVKLAGLRSRLDREAQNLNGYGSEVGEVEGGTKQLLGRITTESFARVGRIFGDIILKADVGVIDTAWSQKRERTDSITTLEEKKQKELKALGDEFSEVLKEVE